MGSPSNVHRSRACRVQEQVTAPGGCGDCAGSPGPGPSAGRSPPPESGFFPGQKKNRRTRWRTPKDEPKATEFDPWRELLQEDIWRAGRPMPEYVRNCARNPERTKEYWGYSWMPDKPEEQTRFCYRCGSWRCDFGCAEHERHVLYTRVTDALEGKDARDMVMMVLTLDGHLHDLKRVPSGTSEADDDPDRRRMLNLEELFRTLGARKQRLFQRLNRFLESTCTRCGLKPKACRSCGSGRLYKRLGLRCRDCRAEQRCRDGGSCHYIGGLGSSWYRVLESHESGVPHLNFVIHHPRWAWWVNERIRKRIASGTRGKRARYIATVRDKRDDIDDELARMLNECGFGYASTCEQARDKEKLTNYMIKLAAAVDEVSLRMATQLAKAKADVARGVRRKAPTRKQYRADELVAAELTKSSQRPVMAPRGTRRAAAGRRFLAPRHKSGKTGIILKHETNAFGDVRAVPLQTPKRPDLMLMQELLIDLEQRIIYDAKLEKGRREILRQARPELTRAEWQQTLQYLADLGELRAVASNELATLNMQGRQLHDRLSDGVLRVDREVHQGPVDNRAIFQQLGAMSAKRGLVRHELRTLEEKGRELAELLGVVDETRPSTRNVSKHKLDVALLRSLGLLATIEIADEEPASIGGDAPADLPPPEPLSFDERLALAIQTNDRAVVEALVESLRLEVLGRATGPPGVIPPGASTCPVSGPP
jgi:hypothetical protein